MQVILRPYENALKSGGIVELCELAEVAGIDVRSFANWPQCLGAIFARYMPSLDVLAAAADLRQGATEPVIPHAQKRQTDVQLPEAGFAVRGD